MKTHQTSRFLRGCAALVSGFALFASALSAAPFTFAPGDLVLTIRQSGAPGDLVVNIGKATNFSALPPGISIPITNLTTSQLLGNFPSVNELQWSVSAANRPPVQPNFPLHTLWVAAPRLDPLLPASPWRRKGSSAQGNAGSQIEGVGVNAALTSNLLPAGTNNTVTGVLVPGNAAFPIGPVIGVDGNYQGTFQGKVENITPVDFDSDANNVSRSDLYELLPGTISGGTFDTPGRYIGYFELKPNGALTFTTASPALVAANIRSIQRVGGVATVSFTTGNSGTYRLRATSVLGAPANTWSIVSGPVNGTGAILSLQETNAASVRFFAVEAQP
jgi:hypothetical protein